MWFFDERAVTSVIAATKRPKRISFEEWLRLDNPPDAGFAAERLRGRLRLPAEQPAPSKPGAES